MTTRALTPWLLRAPALVLYTGLLVVPMLLLVGRSFTVPDGTGPTLANYAKFFGDTFYLGVLGRTLRLAAITVGISAVLGYVVAFQLVRLRPRARAALTLVVAAPLLISVIARTFGWIVMLGPNGLVNRILQALGIVADPLPLLFTEAAIVVGLVHVLLPYMVLSITASLERIDPLLMRAALSLGASPAEAFARVTFPLSLPGLVAGCLIVFALASTSFVTPAILGGSQLKVTSALVYQQSLVLLNWPFSGAIAVIMLSVTSVFIVASARWTGGRAGVE